MGKGGVAKAVGPLARHRLVEALDLAVCAWPVGQSREVFDPAGREELTQGAVLHIAEGVVASSHRNPAEARRRLPLTVPNVLGSGRGAPPSTSSQTGGSS